jgi:hypothetical protein
MNKKKINDTSTPILKSSQSNTDNLASNDLNTKKRKADVLSYNDETCLSNSSISSAQSTDNVGFTNSNSNCSSDSSSSTSISCSNNSCNTVADGADEMVVSFKTTYEYFSKDNEISKWICKECSGSNIKKYSFKSSKSSLDYHLENDHQIMTPKTTRNTGSMSKEKSDLIDRALLILIIACCLPFVLVESKAFKDFVACLNPDYKVPCRKKLRSLLTQLYREKVELLKTKLALIKVISITTDGYTSCQNYSYISATGHFISEKSNFISFCLGFAYVNGRHQADNLKEALQKIFDNFNLEDKIMGIVSDNAPNIRNCLNSLKICMNIEPVRCIAHVLQLIVKNVIDIVDEGEKDENSKFYQIGQALSKCRKIVTTFNHSSQLNDLLEESQIESGIEKKHILHLIQDVKTRWHSTFLMAERMLKLHSYVKNIFNSKQQYKEMRKNLLNEVELENLKETVKALECFNQISVLLSGDSYVTCSLIVPSIKYLQKHLSKTKSGSPTLIIELKSSLLESLNEYSKSYKLEEDPYLLCATFLDPNYKCFQFFDATEKKNS